MIRGLSVRRRNTVLYVAVDETAAAEEALDQRLVLNTDEPKQRNSRRQQRVCLGYRIKRKRSLRRIRSRQRRRWRRWRLRPRWGRRRSRPPVVVETTKKR